MAMEEKKFDKPMEEKEFENYLKNSLNLVYFGCVERFKSVCRAFRRGHITTLGFVLPNRPFHNRKNTSKRKGVHSREENEFKKRAYGRITGKTIL